MGIIDNARKVFDEFRRALNAHNGNTNWSIRFEAADAQRLGMSWSELEGALNILASKGLIQRKTLAGAYELTPAGAQACLDPVHLDDVLPPLP